MTRPRSAPTGYDPERLAAVVSATLPRFETIQDGVIEALRRAVLEDVLPPGARLLQEDLAAVFRTSRIPVREALRMLEYEGLVRSEPHRGFTVSRLDADEIEEIFELRTLLESFALRQAIALLTERDVRDLAARYAAMEEAADAAEATARLEEFYLRLYATTARPRLLGLIARLRQEVLRSLRWWQIEPSPRHHSHLFEAVQARDPERAVDELTSHYRALGALLQRYVREARFGDRLVPDAALETSAGRR